VYRPTGACGGGRWWTGSVCRKLIDIAATVGATMPKPLPTAVNTRPPSFQIRFASLFRPGRSMAFPCDARGCVDLDALSESARGHYLFARAMVGRDYAAPCIALLPGA
jgi:hypothetical protein